MNVYMKYVYYDMYYYLKCKERWYYEYAKSWFSRTLNGEKHSTTLVKIFNK